MNKLFYRQFTVFQNKEVMFMYRSVHLEIHLELEVYLGIKRAITAANIKETPAVPTVMSQK